MNKASVDITNYRYDECTQYARDTMSSDIVHIGFGAFHRGHQAVYNDLTNQVTGQPWGICEINMFGPAQLIDDLNAQQGLFSVVETSATNTVSRLVRTVTEALHTPVTGIQAAIDKIAEPQVKIVSLTITEKGYCADPKSGELDLNNPLIQHDLANPTAPQSAIGLITEALKVRRDKGLPALSVMSCDNIPENGHLTKNVVLSFAKQVDAELASWIKQNVTFPSTMVDRIVPAMTDESFAILEQTTGYADPCGIVCEDFRQWVIEDNFVAGRPEWDKAGAMFVGDVLPYEEMKLRMLNGSHSFLAYNGNLAGFEFIYQCMEDATFKRATRKLMLEEQAKTLSPSLEVNLEEYADLLLARFSNPNVKHKTAQIAMDGSQKLPQRAIDPILNHLERGSKTACLPTLIAGWMHFVLDALNNDKPLHDPLADEFKQALVGASQGVEQCQALMAVKAVFGDLSTSKPEFKAAVEHAFISIQQGSVAANIEAIAGK